MVTMVLDVNPCLVAPYIRCMSVLKKLGGNMATIPASPIQMTVYTYIVTQTSRGSTVGRYQIDDKRIGRNRPNCPMHMVAAKMAARTRFREPHQQHQQQPNSESEVVYLAVKDITNGETEDAPTFHYAVHRLECSNVYRFDARAMSAEAFDAVTQPVTATKPIQ
jgi:hypothetical protein